MRTRYAMLLAGTIAAAVGLAPAARAAGASFPDVPPWHWASAAVADLAAKGIVVGYPATPAELAENSIVQVYEGFAHASAPGSGSWVERFTYDRPAAWPVSEPASYALRGHVPIASYTLTGMQVQVQGDRATAAFTSTVVPVAGARAETAPMRVRLRFNGQDWQVDYATLAAGSPVFR